VDVDGPPLEDVLRFDDAVVDGDVQAELLGDRFGCLPGAIQRRGDDAYDVARREELGDPVGHPLAERGEQEAREAPVEHPFRVVHLAVPDQVDDGALAHRPPPATAAAAAATGRASTTRSSAASSCAAERNHASNALGGR